jgi:antitoxin ParD1/3/4
MAMTSLNISLPEALKEYVEGQVASGDWGTPSEYVRELIRQDRERRLSNLEQDLTTAAKGPKIELSVIEIRKKGPWLRPCASGPGGGEATANYSKLPPPLRGSSFIR